MQFDRHTYEVIGTKMVEEVFKQAAEMYPPCDEPKPSLFKRLLRLVKRETTIREDVPCGDEMNAPSTV